MSKYDRNGFHTTLLVLNVMRRCASHLGLDLSDDSVADRLYWICCDLESYPADQGFGSSDSYGYIEAAEREFGLKKDEVTS
jgi:hypothetical protein